MPTFEIEESIRTKAGAQNLFVAGVDEVGMGPLAGPVVAAAVVLGRPEKWFEYLDDSKKLTRRNRDRLIELIVGNSVAIGIGYSSNDKIDEIGIIEARNIAAIDAFEQCSLALVPYTVAAVVDDSRLWKLRDYLGGFSSLFVDKADSLSFSVAAASIVAKASRDLFMELEAKDYPEYSFEKNKGYGSKAHFSALKKHGPCPLHRASFAPVRSSIIASL